MHMGFEDPDFNEAVVSEGPATLKIKVKKKRYENSDHPIKTWIPCRDDYCDTLLKLKGRSPWWSEGCAICKEANPTWRCEDCFGNRLLCQVCIVEKHKDEPLHQFQEWEGGYFHSRTTQDLGLHYQIGHPFSADCPFNYLGGPSKSFVVLHNNGIHTINVDFCCCLQVPSEVNQLLNVGYVLTLGQHHLQQFMNMMCKRAGRRHDPTGISATPASELAIPCRACPQPGINLPEGWNMAPPEVAWIYRLILSEDANFKLKGRNRSSRENDPTLGPGWAYMVESTVYLNYLAKHVHEDKSTKGLRASGVGSVSCSRHKMFRPLGMGDLQHGEKYSNMDYLWFSSVIGIILLTIITSYDIACQWGRNFWKRARPYSFNYTKGVGRTDGEGVKRNWSWLNLAARSVSVMGPGTREDTIDDLCGFSNWKKTVGLGTGLLRKMVLAIPQAMIHSRAFYSFTTGLREGHEADLSKWEKMVRDWEKDQDHEDSADLYDYAEVEATTMADVLARIAAEEHARVVSDGASALTVKPGPFLIAGIEIQQEQAALQLEAKRLNRTTIQATTLQRLRTLLLTKVKALHDVQDTYMPGLRTWITQQIPVLPTGSNTKPESIPIYLPSSLPANDRQAVCVSSLVEQEEALRNAQANVALRQLCAGLRTRVFAHKFKRKHLGGQGAYTKTRELVDGIENHIRSAAVRYRAARAALLALRGPGPWEQVLQDLKPTDIRGMNERTLNDEEKEDNRKAREGRRNLSWIWYSGGIRDSDVKADGSLHEDIRVEWAKARARAERWREELILLEEEMRRVLEFCAWKAHWWDDRAEARSDVMPELAEGLRAYALAQATRERAWELDWHNKWVAVRERAQMVMRNTVVDVTELVPLEVELEEEEEEAFEEFDDKELL
ncbi:hypothetical protein B0H14DRAFT_2584366 [Mycena olivaceomarginata]|nr:hypothetical protein B0H14DRAFT_2584366 [Mycena olivaceomarginata]